jgi:hypothetical protein
MTSLRARINKVVRRRLSDGSELAPGRVRHVRSESGETLIEVLLALIILGLASVALLTAFGTDISASAEHRSLANFDTALASSIATTTTLIQQQYADVFTACPNPSGSLAAYPSEAAMTSALNISGYTASIEASGNLSPVEFANGNSYSPACSSSNVGDPQLITIVVTDTQTGYSQTNSVVVANPAPVQVTGGNGSAASKLVFVQQPEGATVGTPFTSQPTLEVLDKNGNIVTTDLSPITLTLSGGTAGAALSSTCAGVETSGVVVYSGCSINEVGTAYTLTASEASPTQPGEYLVAPSAAFSVYSAQLATPTITNLTPSKVTAGAINITFTAPANAPAGQTYTAKACTDQAMSMNCTAQTSITSGSDLTGLTQGTSYYVQVTATPSGNYLGATSPPSGPVMATVQLVAPSNVSATYGTVAGSLSVLFTPPNVVAANQTYTVKACTNSAMSTGCVSNTSVTTSGSNLTGLTYTPGTAGTPYYVQVLANASTGYLVSPASPATPSVKYPETSSVKIPTETVAPSASQLGAIMITYAEASGGPTPSSFTAIACTNSGMTVGCITVTNFTSGGQINGLTPASTYYVEIVAVSSTTGYAPATSTVSSTSATVQLMAPTNVVATYGTVAGSLSVTFTPPGTVAPGQTYTVNVCTGVTMTGCVTPENTNYTSGANITGLAYTAGSAGTTYYVEVTANASSGYLASGVSNQSSNAATSQVSAPGTPTAVSSGTTAGAIVPTFTASSGTAPTSYTATACTNAGMNTGCVGPQAVTSGAQLSGLTQGTSYYIRITAVAPTGYVNNNSAVSSAATLATVQLAAPTGVSATYGTAGAGSLQVNFTPSGIVSPTQTYTVNVCTTNTMTGCVTPVNTNYTSGANITGLNYTPGTVGTTYYVDVIANGSTGYLVSPTSSQANHADVSQFGQPSQPVVAASARNGDITVSFNPPSGPAPTSYTALACTTNTMTGASCVGPQTITPGTNVLLGGLKAGSSYYVQITAVATAGYASDVSAVSATAAKAG